MIHFRCGRLARTSWIFAICSASGAALDWAVARAAAAGFAGYEQRMRDYVEANQDIGRMHVQSIIGPGPGAEEGPEPDMEPLMPIIERRRAGAGSLQVSRISGQSAFDFERANHR